MSNIARARSTDERQRRTRPTTVSVLPTATPKIDASPPRRQQQQRRRRQCQRGGREEASRRTDATGGRPPLPPDLSPIATSVRPSVCQTSFAERHCYEQFYRTERRAVRSVVAICCRRRLRGVDAEPYAIKHRARHTSSVPNTSSKYPLTHRSTVICHPSRFTPLPTAGPNEMSCNRTRFHYIRLILHHRHHITRACLSVANLYPC